MIIYDNYTDNESNDDYDDDGEDESGGWDLPKLLKCTTQAAKLNI